MTPWWHLLTHTLQRGWHFLLAPAADPRQTAADVLTRQKALLGRVQQALADNAAARARLTSSLSDLTRQAQQLEAQARQALHQGREDLARLALQQQQTVLLASQAGQTQLAEAQREEQRLSLLEQRLATQIETFHTQQALLAARYSAAEAQVRLTEAWQALANDWTEVGGALEQVATQAEHLQARAAAIDQLVSNGRLVVPLGEGLPTFQPLTPSPPSVETQLAALKQALAA